jgi:hypothetical protein
LVQDGYVAGDDFSLAGGVKDGFGGAVEGGLSASAEYGGSAEGGEFASDGGANAAARSGNDCHLPGQGVPGVHKKGISATQF